MAPTICGIKCQNDQKTDDQSNNTSCKYNVAIEWLHGRIFLMSLGKDGDGG